MVLRVLAGAAAGLEFALQTRDLLFVPGGGCHYGLWRWWSGVGDLLGLDLDVLLLQGVDLAADHLNLLDVTLNWWVVRVSSCGLWWASVRPAQLTLSLIVDAAVGLGVELGADLVEQLVQTLARRTGRGADARRIVVHGGQTRETALGCRCSSVGRPGAVLAGAGSLGLLSGRVRLQSHTSSDGSRRVRSRRKAPGGMRDGFAMEWDAPLGCSSSPEGRVRC